MIIETDDGSTINTHRSNSEATTLKQRSDWQYEVANGDTVLGYAEWVQHQQEANGTTPHLVVEFHYDDGDFGAYDDDVKAAYKLWSEFSVSNPEKHNPTH